MAEFKRCRERFVTMGQVKAIDNFGYCCNEMKGMIVKNN